MTEKFGIDALETAINEQGKPKTNSAKVYMEDGDTLLVRIPDLASCCAHYKAHSYFVEEDKSKNISPFACVKQRGEDQSDPFDEASAYLLAQAKARYNPKTYQKGVSKPDPDFLFGKKLEHNMRIQFGFYNLADGKEIILDFSQKHGNKLLAIMKKAGGKVNEVAFELSRLGAKSNSDYTLQPTWEELTPEQQAHFDACNKPFNVELYDASRYYKPANDQLLDLTKIGFDVTLIGYEVPKETAPASTVSDEEVKSAYTNATEENESNDYDSSDIDNMLEQTEESA